MELFRAHHQWATRPNDERFDSIQAMRDACYGYAMNAAEAEVAWQTLRVEAAERDLVLTGKAGKAATVSNWAFGQLAARAQAPASYLRQLPTTLAAQNLNHGLAKKDESMSDAALLFHQSNGNLVLRAATSDRYSRVWNWEVCDRLLGLEEQGWQPAKPTKNIDWDDGTKPLYASDHDMFAFLVASERSICEAGSDDALYRGVIVMNSEVGASSLAIMRFLYRDMCANHIIWGASEVNEIRIRHRGGSIRSKFGSYVAELRRYLDSSVSDDEAMIATAQKTLIGKTKEEVLDAVFGQRKLGMSRKLIDAGYEAVNPEQDGSPRSKWGLVQGLTRHSQTIAFADERQKVDAAAGKLLAIDF